MSSSYDRMNYITSFGFSKIWRKQMLKGLNLKDAELIVDLMTGMGECWKPILSSAPKSAQLIALDVSGEMIKHAKTRALKFKNRKIKILKQDVFKNSIAPNSADCIISGFGLKTFSHEQLQSLAKEVHKMLKPGGQFSFIDISVPKNPVLRGIFMFYLKRIIPLLGRLFLGNPSVYRMLGTYTERFQNAEKTLQIFQEQGFSVKYTKYFYGCATGIQGNK